MKILKVDFKNFGSYGNRQQTIEFEKEKSDLILVTADNGAGKCVSGKTKIYLDIEDESVLLEFLAFVNTNKKFEFTIKDLYDYNIKTKNVSFKKFKVKTRSGYKLINDIDITAYDSLQYKMVLDSGKYLIGSPDHLIMTPDRSWVKLKDLQSCDLVITIDGEEPITDISILSSRADLYDIEVDEIHEYYANDIVSHNSTLSKVITYMCYGRVDGANLRDLPNRVNSNLWGKILMESKGNTIEIERGISPNIFKVLINGTEYDVAKKTDLQEFLETEIYEIPYHVFKNVIILSINDFKSFISMSPFDKKQIIDRIFGFSIINQMRELVKVKRKTILDEIRTLDDEIRTLDDSIKSILHKIEDYEKISKEKDINKVNDLKNTLVKLNESRQKLKEAIDLAKEKIEEYTKIFRLKSKEESDIFSKINETKKGLKLYGNNECPTCSSPLNSKFHKNLKKEREDLLLTLTEDYESVKSQVIDVDLKLEDLREKNRKIHIKMGELESKMTSFKSELIRVTTEEDQSLNHFKELISEFNQKKEVKDHVKMSTITEENFFSILENILGEDGIKNLAIRSILPTFNNNILLMAKEMNIPFGIKFDEKFNCIIYHLGQEISPKTLSTGERKKIDFVIIIALIKMIKLRFSSLNILFLDEIFSSIDASGVYHIIEILHKSIQEIGVNTFVINHTVLPSEYFDKKIEITKDGGFSELNITSIT